MTYGKIATVTQETPKLNYAEVVEKFAKDLDSAAVSALVKREVLAERERCAKIAEVEGINSLWCDSPKRVGDTIAAAIRSGK